MLCEPVDGNQAVGDPWLRQNETDVRLARDQQRSLSLELKNLLNRSTDGLNDEQIGQLIELLNEHQAVFATSTNPFGHISITQHRIVTGESKPIKQALRQLPLHLKEIAEEEIEKMQSQRHY